MKKFLTILILLGIAGGGVYYYDPGLLGLDAPAESAGTSRKAGNEEEKVAADELEAVASAPAAAPLAILDNFDARARARSESKPSLIIWYGSDWMPNAAKLVAEWNKLEKKGLPVVLGQIDERVGAIPTLEERKNLLPSGEFHNLPVAVLLAPDDTLLAIYQGKTVLSAAAMEKAVNSTLERMPRYMKLVETAESADGIEGARAAADALALQPYSDARRNKKLQDILNSKDPEHKTLFRYLYCMDHMGMYGEINAVLQGGKGADARYNGAERKFDDGIAFVQKILKLRKLNSELEQQWNSGLAYVIREKYRATKEPALRRQLVETYRKVVTIDPESEYGKGASRWADYWDESVPYVFDTPCYDSGDMTTDFEKEWRVNVSEQVTTPGSYTFTLVPYKNGRMTTRGFQLFANDKHVCDANEAADLDTRTVTFTVPRALKGRIEVRFKAQCFDGWFGCSGEMLMKKN